MKEVESRLHIHSTIGVLLGTLRQEIDLKEMENSQMLYMEDINSNSY